MTEGDRRGESEGNVKNSQGDAALLPLKTEVGNHEPRAVGGLSKLEETRKWIPPRACRKSTAPPTP